MKHLLYTIIASAMATSASAQTPYEATNIATSDLNGTARFVGMGGALSALGGDITTAGTNPAGTALLRKTEATISFGGLFTDQQGQLGNDRGKASIDQAGIIFSMPTGGNDVYGFNLGVNYTKQRNFLQNIAGTFNLRGMTQTDGIAGMANKCLWDEINTPNSEPWYGLPDMMTPLHTEDEYMTKGLLHELYGEDGYISGYMGGLGKTGTYSRHTAGSAAQVDINLSANIRDRFFIGASVGVYSLSYTRSSLYEETGEYGSEYLYNIDDDAFEAYGPLYNSYRINNTYCMNGNGVDIKLGMIIRPFEDSGFRIGLSMHTPIWYNLRDRYYCTLNANSDVDPAYNYTDTYDSEDYEYKLRTPWVFNASLGHTIGNYLAIGAEYEYKDMTSCKYSGHEYGYSEAFNNDNNTIKNTLRGTHTFRLGVEYKPVKEFSVRLGYNYVSSPIKQTATYIPSSQGFTETDYINWKDINRFTIGIGYRFKNAYIDLAYQFQGQKGDLYAFYQDNGNGTANQLSPVSVNNTRSQIMGTLGFRF